MSYPLYAYSWAEEPLCVETAQRKEDIIVEDSDFEDCPAAKAERQQRREAIGRAYLKGHIPFVLSAQLRGPFSHGNGWVNPWKKVRQRRLKHTTALPISEDWKPTKSDRPRLHSDSKTCALETRHGRGHPSSRGSPNKSQSEGEEDVLQSSQEDRERLIKRKQAKRLKSTPFMTESDSDSDPKMTADLGWLRGAHVSECSGYEMPQYSTPTLLDSHRHALSKQKRRGSMARSVKSMPLSRLPSLPLLKANSAPPETQRLWDQTYKPTLTEKEVQSLEVNPSIVTAPVCQALDKAVNHGTLNANTVTEAANVTINYHSKDDYRCLSSSALSGSFRFRKVKRRKKAGISSLESRQEEIIGHSSTDGLSIESRGPTRLSDNDTSEIEQVNLNGYASSEVRTLSPQQFMSMRDSPSKAEPRFKDFLNDGRVDNRGKNPRTQLLDVACNMVVDMPDPQSSHSLLVTLERQEQLPPRAPDDEAQEQLISEARSCLSTRPAKCDSSPSPNTNLQFKLPFVQDSSPNYSYSGRAGVGELNLDKDSNPPGQSEECTNDFTFPTLAAEYQTEDPHDGNTEGSSFVSSRSNPWGHDSSPKFQSLCNSGPPESLDIVNQSPWTVTGADPPVHFHSSWFGAGVTKDHGVKQTYGQYECDGGSDARDEEIYPGEHKEAEDDIRVFEEFLQSPQTKETKAFDESLSRVPSTQSLVDATTANPWTSAFKKPRSGKSRKRVSFSPSVLGGATPRSSLSQTRQLGSPPPRLGIAAFQRLEVKEDVHIKLMDALKGNRPSRLIRSVSVSASPATDAMAKAFIAADKQTFTTEDTECVGPVSSLKDKGTSHNSSRTSQSTNV